jgi:hypothetical protein
MDTPVILLESPWALVKVVTLSRSNRCPLRAAREEEPANSGSSYWAVSRRPAPESTTAMRRPARRRRFHALSANDQRRRWPRTASPIDARRFVSLSRCLPPPTDHEQAMIDVRCVGRRPAVCPASQPACPPACLPACLLRGKSDDRADALNPPPARFHLTCALRLKDWCLFGTSSAADSLLHRECTASAIQPAGSSSIRCQTCG